MQTEKMQIILPDGTTEITIREGVAVQPLPLKEPKSLSYTGNIHAISDYVKVRRENADGVQALDLKKVVVLVNEAQRTINLNTDPAGHYNTTVTAKLEQSTELAQFSINCDRRFTRKDLLKLLKFGRGHFADRGQYDRVIEGMNRIRVKTIAEIEQESNGKGRKANIDVSESVMQEGFVDTFTLAVPLFKGFDKENIVVEICWEVLNGEISFWLESVGLKELSDSKVSEIIEKELESVSEFVIIHQ